MRYYWSSWKHLKLENGVLYYLWKGIPEDLLLLVVPKELQDEVLTHCHNHKVGGHFGRQGTIAKVRRFFYWYNVNTDCNVHVKTCSVCNKNRKGPGYGRALHGQYHAGAPLDRVHIDILRPLPPSKDGNVYILMLVNQFTKWLECWALPNQTVNCFKGGQRIH